MDDIKLFAKNEKELATLLQSVRIYSQDIGIEFAVKMCHASNEKRQTTPDGRNETAKSKRN